MGSRKALMIALTLLLVAAVDSGADVGLGVRAEGGSEASREASSAGSA